MQSPYEYHNDKLGVKLNFLISDGNKAEESLCVIAYRALRKRLDVRTSKEKLLRRACLNTSALVEYDTICQEWKDLLVLKFGEPKKIVKQAWFESYYVLDSKAYDFYLNFTYGKAKRLTTDLINEYTFNASVLNTVRICKAERKSRWKMLQKTQKLNIWEILAIEVENIRATVPHTIPVKSLRNKFTEYDQNGYEAIISGKLQNDNAKKMNLRIMKLLNSLFATQTHKPTATEVARQYEAFLNGYNEVVNTETGEQYNPKEFTPLSKGTIINYLSAWENKLATHSIRRNDRQKLMGAFVPSHSLSRPKFAGSLTSIDDRKLPFHYDKNGNRVWFYIGVDVASNFIHTYVYGKDKQGIMFDFYRQMVRNHYAWGFNLPYELECESNLNSSFKDTLLQDGAMFQKVHIVANNARGKIVERKNGTMRYEYDKKHEGFVGRFYAKQEANSDDGVHQVIPYDTIVYNAIKDIETDSNMAHDEQTKLSRWEYFCAYQNKDLTPINWRMILKYLGYVTKTSCKVGEIALQSGKYLLGDNGSICTGEALIDKMKECEGRTLEIYWLDDNEGKIIKAHIYIGNDFIGEAIAKPVYNRSSFERTEYDEAKRTLMSKYVMTVEGFRKQQTKEIEPVAIINERPKTVNNNFVAPELKRFEVREQKPAEELEIKQEEEQFEFVQTNQTNTNNLNQIPAWKIGLTQ